jgi:Uma2 family endonuclease
MRAPELAVSRELFVALAGENPDVRLERARDGTLIVVPPTGFDGGRRNFELCRQLGNWNAATGAGVCSDSSGGFELPDSAIRSADAAWISSDRWNGLSKPERETFSPLCPDLRKKMLDYVENGARLGWLIDPYQKRVEVYRPSREPEVLEEPASLSGEDVLPGFVLDLAPIFAD